MSDDLEMNTIINDLYYKILCGETNKQASIDSYIAAEIVLRDQTRAKRLRSLYPDQNLAQLLQTPPSHTIHCTTLPDIGNIIRTIVFFSGDCPSNTNICNEYINCCVYDALPNIKRTKQVKHKINLKTLPNQRQQINVICSIIMGTLLALYPHCAKSPNFRQRCDIIQNLHKLQCIPLDKKITRLNSLQNLVKICFMEYTQWFITNYMPTEKTIMARSNTTACFQRACPNVCDIFRQDIILQNTCDFDIIDKMALQAIERCNRLCKFKMQRHIYIKECNLSYPQQINRQSFAKAMLFVPSQTYQNTITRYRPRVCYPIDKTKEIHILHAEETDYESIKYASILHHHLKINKLPRNIALQQLMAVKQQHPDCLTLQKASRQIYLCFTCILKGKLQEPKFRMSLCPVGIQCNTCNNDYSIFKIDLIGKAICLGGKTIVMCTKCSRSTLNKGDGNTLSLKCSQCTQKSTPKHTITKRKICFFCEHTAHIHDIPLLNYKTMSIENVHLCNKHGLNHVILQHIHDCSELQAAVMK